MASGALGPLRRDRGVGPRGDWAGDDNRGLGSEKLRPWVGLVVKRGTVVKLTEGQIVACYAALSGYLAELESAGGDYRLFPAGQLPGGRSGSPHAVERHRHAKPIGRRRIIEWFHAAEGLAGIESVPGRAAYGLRRAAVDAAKVLGISREALKEHGGWADTQIPDRIYADQEAEFARDEARAVREQIRGEKTATKRNLHVTPPVRGVTKR